MLMNRDSCDDINSAWNADLCSVNIEETTASNRFNRKTNVYAYIRIKEHVKSFDE